MKAPITKILIATVIIVMLITACASAATPTTAPVQPTQAPAQPTTPPQASGIVLHALLQPDEGNNVADYTALFEKQTGIKVQVDFVGWDTIHDKTVTTLASGGGGYDIVFIPSADAIIDTATDQFEPIDDLIPANEREQWLETVLNLYTYQGHLVAMPWYSGGAHFAYNKDILSKAGVDPDKIITWDDFMAACETIKEKGAADYCFTPSAKYPAPMTMSIGTILLSYGGDWLDASGNPVFQNGDAGLKMYTMLKDGIDKGYFNKAGIDMDDYATLIEFGTGKTAFLLDSTWSVTNANNNKDVSQILGKVGYMLIPGMGDTRSGGYLYAGALGILKSSTHKDEAKAYIQLQTGEAAQKDHAIKGANMPTRVALFTDPDIASSWPGFEVLANQITYLTTTPPFTWQDEWAHSLATTQQDVMAGRKTPAEAIQWLVDETNRIRGGG
jgi:ABC-type glycerol-3-phosphate transport system substrate-binding protein